MAVPIITISVPGEPIAQPRPRVFRSKSGKAMAVSSASRRIKTWRERIILAAQQQYDGPPLDGPLYLEVTFRLPRPKRLMRKRDPEGDVPCDKRPDLDNLLKAIKDGLGSVLWRDDSQVARVDATKVYHSKNGKPGAIIKVRGYKARANLRLPV